MPKLTKLEYDPSLEVTILERWRATHCKRAAAWAAGLSEDTVARWVKLGEEGDPRFVEFTARWKKAASDWITERCLKLREIGLDGNWQTLAWQLERQEPESFARTENVKQEVTGKDGGPLGISVSIVPPQPKSAEHGPQTDADDSD